MGEKFKFWEEEHEIGNPDCDSCGGVVGGLLRCECGGLVHVEPDGDYEEDTVLLKSCDKCGDDYWEVAT